MRLTKYVRVVETIEDYFSELMGRFERLPPSTDEVSKQTVSRLFADYATAYDSGDDDKANEVLASINTTLASLESTIGQASESLTYRVTFEKVGGTTTSVEVQAATKLAAVAKVKLAEGSDVRVLRVIPIVTEGPLDFAGGVGRALGGKIAQSKFVQGAKQVYAAGQIASAAADLNKIFKQVSDLIEIKRKLQPAQQPAQQPANPFKASHKPKMIDKPGYGRMYQFSSHLIDRVTSGKQLNERIGDFVAGATNHIGGAVHDKISNYANASSSRGTFFRDLYDSGKAASLQADERKRLTQDRDISRQIVKLLNVAASRLRQLGNQSQQVLDKALAADVPHADRIRNILKVNATKLRIQVESIGSIRDQLLMGAQLDVLNVSHASSVPDGKVTWGELEREGASEERT